VIRAKCLDCCCGQVIEVTRCTATGCALWPFRMAKNPFRHYPHRRPPPRGAASTLSKPPSGAAPSSGGAP
jgi:hypothetical protein